MAYKDYFGTDLAQELAARIGTVYPGFAAAAFVTTVAGAVKPLALKARVALIAQALRQYLPDDYPTALTILRGILGPENPNETGTFSKYYWLMPVAYFVEAYGLDDPVESLDTLSEITCRHTAEYAVRPFIDRHYDLAMARLQQWADSPNFHHRRLASEGTRTRLPWARRLHRFVHDPEPVLTLLAPLKADPSAYVRKSVANNLHDIAADHPERVLALCDTWAVDAQPETRWIIRHALRNLRKHNDPAAVELVQRLQ